MKDSRDYLRVYKESFKRSTTKTMPVHPAQDRGLEYNSLV